MTVEFLFAANVVLLLRMGLLLTDKPAGVGLWGMKTVVEWLTLLCFVPQPILLGAGAASLVFNAAGYCWDRREGERNAGHLIIGLMHLLALSVFFSRTANVGFRPEWLAVFQELVSWSALGALGAGLVDARVLKLGFGLLLVANEANLVIRMILGGLHLKPGDAVALDQGEYNRGRVIGLLERVLIYCFVLSGQFGAIGFTLAAKGFTRFKEMENRSFAEYVLIGTLLSSGLAMLAGVTIKYALH